MIVDFKNNLCLYNIIHYKHNNKININDFTVLSKYPNYLINRDGIIINKNGYIMSQIIDKKGYVNVLLHINKQQFLKRVHRLVAETFIPNPNNYPQINHKDENKQNNNIKNLEWCNNKYNINYGTVKKRIAKSHSVSIYSVDVNTKEIVHYNSILEAANILNIQATNICKVLKGKAKTCNNKYWYYD